MLSYTHFTTDERKCLQKLLEEGYSIRGAAAALGRSPSSVSREIKRNHSVRKTKKNRTNRFCYHYWRANKRIALFQDALHVHLESPVHII